MTIPTYLLNDIRKIPSDRPVTLLMRHSVRFPITNPDEGFLVPLTEEGVRLAEELGAFLSERLPAGRLLASPVGRCLATADAIARGAGWSASARADERLSHPFIEPAWDLLCQNELNGELPEQIRTALDLLLEQAENRPRLDVMVTHDTMLGAVVGCWLRAPVLNEYWPGYLEGLFVWRSGNQIHARWREQEQVFDENYNQRAGLLKK